MLLFKSEAQALVLADTAHSVKDILVSVRVADIAGKSSERNVIVDVNNSAGDAGVQIEPV